MAFPKKAIFAFNANIDHVKFAVEEDMQSIERFSPQLHSQMSECFSWGVQKEVAIDAKAAEFFLSNFKYERILVGGQAGNAAEQASLLGVECLLHTNSANEKLAGLFSERQKVYFASEKGFVPAGEVVSQGQSAHHFVFENAENRTRFIASHDPVPLHPDDDFCRHVEGELPFIGKAFIGGLHLLKTQHRVGKFAAILQEWKETSPSLRIFLELGEFQDDEVKARVLQELFPLVDMVGLNDTELAALGMELEELAGKTGAVLFHTPEQQLVLPEGRQNGGALSFARKCASFRAKNGRCGTLQEMDSSAFGFIENPAHTVGLGDTFSCAYFMAD